MSSPSEPQNVVLDLDSLPPSRGTRTGGFLSNVHRTHSRSASWSLANGQATRPAEFGRGLVGLNPMTPITNAIREIVPSFGRSNSSVRSSPHLSRNASQTSLLLGTSELEEVSVEQTVTQTQDGGHDSLRTLGDSSSNVNVHLPREHTAVHMGPQPPPEEPNVGLELSDSMRWLEQNAIFIILLLMKFAWYHRSGEGAVADESLSLSPQGQIHRLPPPPRKLTLLSLLQVLW